MADAEGLEDDNQFPSDDIEAKIQEVTDEVLKDTMWDEKLVPTWINTISEKLMALLVELQKPYKYMITVVMQQRTGATISSTYSCFFENTTDGVVVGTFPPTARQKEHQGKTVQAQITVFGTRF